MSYCGSQTRAASPYCQRLAVKAATAASSRSSAATPTGLRAKCTLIFGLFCINTLIRSSRASGCAGICIVLPPTGGFVGAKFVRRTPASAWGPIVGLLWVQFGGQNRMQHENKPCDYNRLALGDASPEKAGGGGSTPSLATIKSISYDASSLPSRSKPSHPLRDAPTLSPSPHPNDSPIRQIGCSDHQRQRHGRAETFHPLPRLLRPPY